MAEQGKVWLVGAGPGDPSLITVRGLELLRRADVVLYDSLSHPALLMEADRSAELRNVGKRGGSKSPSQGWITEQLVELAREGKSVVRLKGGDSFLFARGAEEAEDLAAAGVSFEVVPGLSSPVGTSAYAGIPLTHRNASSSVTFITGTDKQGRGWSREAWQRLATATETICVLMGMRRLYEITSALVSGGRDPETPAAVIQWGARPEQRVAVGTLATIAQQSEAAGLSNPAVVIIGEVVRLREVLSWYEKKPLFGLRILVPRPAHQAFATAEKIRAQGAEPVLFPVIEICDPPEPAAITPKLDQLKSYDWVLFTSANGVERFFKALHKHGLDSRALGENKIGVIGPKTGAALHNYGLKPDLVAKEFVAEGLVKSVLSQGVCKRILIPRALVAREHLPRALRAAGLHVDVLPVYETRGISSERSELLRKLLRDKGVHVALFTSSSTVSTTASALGELKAELFEGITVASIGPVTSRTAEAHGLSVDVTADVYTVDGLLEALARSRA